MTDVFVLAQTALNTLTGIPSGADVILNLDGSIPDTYVVYDVVSAAPTQHADNAETERLFRVQVSIYCRDGYSAMPNVDGAMLAAGFSRGDWRQLPRDESTGHFALAKDYTILIDQN